MAKVLAISSYVALGHVGLGASAFALARLGHEVVGLPTVVLSNHPGHARSAGFTIAPEKLAEMVGVYGHAGLLGGFDAVLTGYLPTREHALVAAHTVRAVRMVNPSCRLCCDPILGDDPGGLYIDEAAAAAIRDELLPLSDIATPNRFELAWLAGRTVQTVDEAAAAFEHLGMETGVVTSLSTSPGRIGTLLFENGAGWLADAELLREVPHGTGDFLTGLLLGWLLKGEDGRSALSRSAAGVEIAVTASAGADELDLVGTQERWSNPAPCSVTALGGDPR